MPAKINVLYLKFMLFLCQKLFFRYCKIESNKILPALLPEDSLQQVETVACQICCRMGCEKVDTWMNSHITKGIVSCSSQYIGGYKMINLVGK